MDLHHVETALMLWEEYTTLLIQDRVSVALYSYQAANGVYSTRHACIAVAKDVNALWDELQGGEDEYLMDGLAFDFEFIPALFAEDLFDEYWQLRPYAYERMCAWRDNQQLRWEAKYA